MAERLTGGPIAPPSTLSLWFRPHHWQPDQSAPRLPLQVHFDLKDALDLPEAVMSDSEVAFHEPVRPGDVISTSQVLRSLSGPKTTKLGTGRFWVIDVPYRNQDGVLVGVETFTGFGYRRAATSGSADTGAGAGGEVVASADGAADAPRAGAGRWAAGAVLHPEVGVGDRLPALVYDVTATTVVLGALATRDWRPMHHDRDFAIERNGAKRHLPQHAQPAGVARAVRHRLDRPGGSARAGAVPHAGLGLPRRHDDAHAAWSTRSTSDDAGCGWASVAVELRAGGRPCTTASLRIALPLSPDDNPWRRTGDRWVP